ncbi:uncharacterized protein LOC133528918 [Cydia pomonella]|uniref:uncharacterized protein LOC133528918 n=1 Tax=Cydia pomonella TaxID=82600 RepID=UPI002ADE0710|nr:uncharacterized protein LOC133528918 [Cydia pomonella]
MTKKTKNENATIYYNKESLYSYDAINNVILMKPLHQMAWNKNIQLFYYLSMPRPKPIILTRRQYNKLKRRIYSSLIAKHNTYLAKDFYNDRRLHNLPDHTLEIVRANTKNQILHYDKDSQTENVLMNQICATVSDVNTYTIGKSNCGDAGSTDIGNSKMSSSSNTFENSRNTICSQKVINVNNYHIMHNTLRTIYIARNHIKPNNERVKQDHVMKTESVKDIEYRKMAIRKQRVRFSSSHSANYLSRTENVNKMDSCSIQTIFKCQRKSLTPNLGTSACTLSNSSENIDSRFKFFEDSIQDKPKKPFLKRLISCLVFKTSPVSQTKHPRGLLDGGSPNNSFDSYYISTSLGAIEMSSSLYETSASFYSDHTVPGTKIKRGFLSSVRGLLTRKC